MDHRITIGILLLLALGCKPEKKPANNQRLSIVATTGMIEDAIKNIVGDSADVIALMGPGVDPHLYKATHGDLEKLTDASVIFYNGLHLEGKMGEVLEKIARLKPVFAVAEGVEKSKLRKVPEFDENYDPHIWFDVSIWSQAVEEASRQLQRIDSVNASYYDNNTKIYLGKLNFLHQWVKKEVQSLPPQQRILITAHDAFGYFGEAYNIEVRGLQGISTVSEYGLRDVSDLVKYIVENKVKAVFVETSVSRKAVNAVVAGCKERGFDVKIGGNLYSDAMGAKGTEEGTYIGMVKANVNTIINALK